MIRFPIISGLVLMTTLVSAIPGYGQGSLTAAVSAFDEGNRLLQSGEFDDALTRFKEAEQSGTVSAALYHNMGLTYFRMDELGRAIQYLERAHRLDPDSGPINHSLSVARAETQDQFSSIGTPFLKRAHRWILTNVPAGWLLGIGLAAWLLWVGLHIARMLFGFDGSWWRRARSWSGIAAVILLALAYYSALNPPFETKAVILQDSVTLKEQPDETSPDVTLVHEGLVVVDLNGANDWRLIQLPNGTRGWIPASAAARI